MTEITPTRSDERTKNPLRPSSLDEMVGQQHAKRLMRAALNAVNRREQVLDHTLIVGPSGTGKSTLSHAVACELEVVDVYELEAPVSMDMLLQLREQMLIGDILKIEEIHQQAIMERRGRTGATQPEVLYAVMEDRTIPTEQGVLPFPQITVIGTTTDEGKLPDAFVNRFPLRPIIEPYAPDELHAIARWAAEKLNLDLRPEGADVLVGACRRVPRELNNLLRNAAILTGTVVDGDVARDVLDLNSITEDGLTRDMQQMLVFLYTRAAQTTMDGEVRYQASVNTIATAIGKSRDSKAVAMRVEPYLIENGWVQVTHGGRRLTDAGVERAKELLP